MNLVEELGIGYMSDRFEGCMFFDPDNRPNYLNLRGGGQREGSLRSVAVTGTATQPAMTENWLPYDFFKDLSVFSVPPLGWRAAAQGRYLARFSRKNKCYHRGIAHHILNRELSPATNYLVATGNVSNDYYNRVATTVSMIMKPEYTAFGEGIELMRRGKLFSFCVNSAIAVIPESEDRQAIYLNSTKAAIVCENGRIEFTTPFVDSALRDQLT